MVIVSDEGKARATARTMWMDDTSIARDTVRAVDTVVYCELQRHIIVVHTTSMTTARTIGVAAVESRRD